uniref:Uncharacterized protein n=1 Tax=Arundo donax TaxID=35708 RepID=A0A0A9I095_ARUDO
MRASIWCLLLLGCRVTSGDW